MDLKGRGVFLTGGAQGIGKAIAEALLKEGARVVFCDLKAETGLATKAEFLRAFSPDDVDFVQCDVTNAQQLKAAFDVAVSKFGAVEICCNNAGIMDETIWEKMIAINTTAQIRGSQIALEHMRRDKGGKGGVIVNTVSVAGLVPGYWLPVYMASKHAMIGYTTSLATDPQVPTWGVRICALCPNAVDTTMLQFKGEEVKNQEEFHTVIKPGMLQIEDVVKAFMEMLKKPDNNGCLLVVERQKGGVYRRRALVDDDGESNLVLIDRPLTNHPALPGDGQ